MCSSIMGDSFDIVHVKQWSYELARAYFHGPIALSPWGLDLLMECPQDHFTFDALGKQGGGEKFVFAFIDCLIQYLHTLTISMQCIAPQEGKLFIWLHGQFWAKLYDGDNHLLCGLGQELYHFMYVQLMYYSLVYVITYIINHVLRNNLPCNFLKQQFRKFHCNYMGNCWYFPAPHETFSISLILMLIMISFSAHLLCRSSRWRNIFRRCHVGR